MDQSELGSAGADDAASIPTCRRAGASATRTGSSAPACSTSSCRACRWTSATADGGGATSSSRTTARSGRADYDEVTLTAPLDPRLPGGGGYPVSFLVRNNNSVLGVSDPYYTTDQRLRRRDALLAWRGLHAQRPPDQRPAVPGRHQHRTRRQRHLRRADRPVRPADDAEHAPTRRPPSCHRRPADCSASEPWLTTFRGLASYTIPKVDVLVSAIVRSQANVQPGADVATNGALARGQLPDERGAVPGRHRPAAAPGRDDGDRQPAAARAVYGERVNNLDMRVAKIVRIKGTRANVGVDFYNLTNANTPTTVESTYDPAIRRARGGCGRRRCCSRGSCASTCSSTSNR